MALLRFERRGVRTLAIVGGALCLALSATSVKAQCAGDCDGDKTVAINELITCVNIALGSSDASTCTACDTNGDSMVSISELISAVNVALDPSSCSTTGGC